MNRREFVLAAAACSTAITSARRALGAQQISVVDHGADPSGKRDSTIAIQAAISAMKARGAPLLVFPQGTYRLMSAQRSAMDFTHMSNFEVDGGGSTILIGPDARCFTLVSSNAVIHDLVIDWDPLPFTQGTVTASGLNWFTLKIDSGFPVPTHADVAAFGAYDRSLKNLAPKLLEVYGSVSSVQAVGPNELRIELTRLLAVPAGTVLVLRFKLGHEAIAITGSQNIAVRNLRIHSSYSFGFSVSRSRDLRFEDVTIGMPARSNRLLSTNADGMHITNCSGDLVIQRGVFEGMGDDAININAGILRFQANAPVSGALTNHAGSVLPASEMPDPRDHLDILDPHDLHVIGHASTAPTANGTMSTQLEESIGSSALNGALIVDTDSTPTTRIVDCRFNGNRARAIVAHNNLQVENCTFQNTTHAAILLAPDSIWMEGPATRNVTIQSSHFSGCHYLSKDPEGSITIDVMHSYSRRTDVPNGEAANIRIIENSFDSCPTAAITCRSADQLVIESNHFGPTWIAGDGSAPPRAMILAQLTNSIISKNISTAPNAIVIKNSEHTTVSANEGFILQG
jgi:uncharacterized protein GlcG (DUF336 family)